MKKLFSILCLLIYSAANCYGLDWIPFTVTRHVDTTFTQATFDNDMSVINGRLKYDNHHCIDDIPCSVRFVRSGALGTYGTSGDGLDLITTGAELDAVFNVTTHRAKMVTGIDYCSGTYNPSIVGCGKCDEFGFIVETGQPGNVFVHEYGHNVMGCGHRDDCSWNIMHSITTGNNDSLNGAECSGYGGSAYTQLCGDVYNGSGGPLTVSGGPYWLTCNVTVPAGQTLTINAGVEIQFDQGGRTIKSFGTTSGDGESSRIDIYSNNETNNFPSITVDGLLSVNNGGELILQ